MNVPNNCTECPYYKICDNACYGSLNCKYREEIVANRQDK